MSATQQTHAVVESIARTAVENEQYFCDLDSVVGDGDFGYSLARGFEKVLEELATSEATDPSALLQATAMTISARTGGTSGPIWGTAFLRAATSLKGKTELAPDDVVAALRASVVGIQARGKAELGDKTLLDALVPAIDALEQAAATGATREQLLTALAEATRAAAEATSELQAMRGRASYSGARSVGSPDAGAIALAVMAERLATDLQPSNEGN